MAIEQRFIPLKSPLDWKEALRGIKHTFGHTWENCYAMQLTTGLRTYLYSFEKDDIRFVCPIAEREFGGYVDITKPFGFSGFVGNGSLPELSVHWREFVGERGYICGYLGLNPLFDYSSHFDSRDIFRYNTIYVLDLTMTDAELFAKLSTNRKRQLKDWDEISSTLVFQESSLKEFFFENYFDFLRRKNASPVYFLSVETLSYLFCLDNVILVGAKESGHVVAVSVFTYTADAAEYLFNVSVPKGRQHAAALVWYAVRYFKSLGIPIINLGGGSAEFKRRFGSKELPIACLKQVYQPEVYRMLCRRVEVDANDMGGYFPAYRKRDIEREAQEVTPR
ncbi:MAG: hypothetical protein A2Y81_03185 [Nitrospirae bacterium RBG_13_43_8]|nr:MAG: hypothetical protein A2Y81_03185 [Nitrospirae bacterium RBG_13_43_8]